MFVADVFGERNKNENNNSCSESQHQKHPKEEPVKHLRHLPPFRVDVMLTTDGAHLRQDGVLALEEGGEFAQKFIHDLNVAVSL